MRPGTSHPAPRLLRAVGVASAGAFVVLGAACTAVLGIEDTQRAAPTDTGVEVTPGADWTCVGKVNQPVASVAKITITAIIVDFVTGKAPLDDKGVAVPMKVVACGTKTDKACSVKLAEVTSPTDGVTKVEIPIDSGSKGFNGYLRVTGPGYVPYLWYFSRPLADSRSFPLAVLTVPTLEDPKAGLLQGFKLTATDDRGQIAVQATDCGDVPAGKVKFAVEPAPDSGSAQFYFADGVPAPVSETDDKGSTAGLGGFWNLKAGTYVVKSLPTALGGAVVAGSNSVIIEPHALTTIRLLPN